MFISEALAVGAAASIALVSMIVAELHGRLDVLTLTKWQTIIAALMTAALAAAVGGWGTVKGWHVPYMVASGFFGTTLANTFFLAAIFAIGARSATLLFSLNAPFALLLGYLYLGETIRAAQGLGVALVVAGIVLAVLYRPAPSGRPAPEAGLSLTWGLLFGVAAALCQAVANLVARPAMSDHLDPFAAMAIRSAFAAFCFVLVSLLPLRLPRPDRPASTSTLAIGVLAAGATTGISMSLLMAALESGKVGIVSTLSSLAPVLVLPMLWLRTGHSPSLRAWLGALLAVAGIAAIALG